MLPHAGVVVRTSRSARAPELQRLLQDLSFVKVRSSTMAQPPLELSVQPAVEPFLAPRRDRSLFERDGLSGFIVGNEIYVSVGRSAFHVQPQDGRGTAHLTPDFFTQPTLCRQRFWAFALLILLRSRGLYGLHAAGVVNPAGPCVLIIGPSGSGKSTLTIGLLRAGWGYLSDDAVLLRRGEGGIDALALRKPFSVDIATSADHADVPLGPAPPRAPGGHKRRYDVQVAYPAQYCSRSRPTVLVFPRIVRDTRSTLAPLSRAAALGRLFAQSGPEMFERQSLPGHAAVLVRLLRQASSYDLCAGADLHHRPMSLASLLAKVWT